MIKASIVSSNAHSTVLVLLPTCYRKLLSPWDFFWIHWEHSSVHRPCLWYSASLTFSIRTVTNYKASFTWHCLWPARPLYQNKQSWICCSYFVWQSGCFSVTHWGQLYHKVCKILFNRPRYIYQINQCIFCTRFVLNSHSQLKLSTLRMSTLSTIQSLSAGENSSCINGTT